MNYYLDEGSVCRENPLPAIPDCDVYGEGVICRKCALNFYLNNNQCLEADPSIHDKCKDLYIEAEVVKCRDCFLNYTLSDGNCIDRVKVEDCEVDTPNVNDCDRCLNNKLKIFILKLNVYKCIDGPADCLEVSVDGDGAVLACERCKEEHYPAVDDQRNCEPAVQGNNCKFYNKSRECIECTQNYRLDNKNCVEREAIDNCKLFDIDTDNCLVCQDTFFKYNVEEKCPQTVIQTQNLRMLSIHNLDNQYKRSPFGFNGRKLLENNNLPLNSRILATPGEFDCATFFDFPYQQYCKTCQDVNLQIPALTKNCLSILNANDKITDCLIYDLTAYTDDSVPENIMCSICTLSKELTVDNRACVDPILNCQQLQLEDSTKCDFCEIGFLLTIAETECIDHSNIVATNCERINPAGDKCEYCSIGSALALDETQCLNTSITNCQILNSQTLTIECKTCKQNFLPTEDLSKCDTEILDCEFLDNTDQTKCDKCVGTSKILTFTTRKCVEKGPTLANCEFADDQTITQCKQCVTNFRLKLDNTCQNTQLAQNCIIYKADDDNKCSVCQTDYIMTVDETCLFKGTDYENCLVAKTSGNNQCETCREGFIPKAVNFQCITKFSNNVDRFERCKIAKENAVAVDESFPFTSNQTTTNECEECIDSDDIMTEGTFRCLSRIKLDGTLDEIFVNCQDADRNYKSNATTYTNICLNCNNDAAYIQSEDKTKCFKQTDFPNCLIALNEATFSQKFCKTCQPSFIPDVAFQCRAEADIVTANCEIASQEQDDNQKYLCSDCKQNFIITQDHTECISTTSGTLFNNCLLANKGATNAKPHCHTCQPNFNIGINFDATFGIIGCSNQANTQGDCEPTTSLTDLIHQDQLDMPNLDTYTQETQNDGFFYFCATCSTNAPLLDMLSCGTIPNCVMYSSQIHCDLCENLHILSYEFTKCLPMGLAYINCQIAFDNIVEQCHTCQPDFDLTIIKNGNDYEYRCSNTVKVNQCKTHVQSYYQIVQNDFGHHRYAVDHFDTEKSLCIECNRDFLLGQYQYKCFQINNCLETDETGEVCVRCEENYKRTELGHFCIGDTESAYKGCKILSDEQQGNTCLVCEDDTSTQEFKKIKNDDGCLDVKLAANDFTVNCKVFLVDQCEDCENTFLITTDKKCVAVTERLQHCEIAIQANQEPVTCDTCIALYDTVTDNTTCYLKSEFPNCKTVDSTFKCVNCIANDPTNLYHLTVDRRRCLTQLVTDPPVYKNCLTFDTDPTDPEDLRNICLTCTSQLGNIGDDSNNWLITNDKQNCYQLNQNPLFGCMKLSDDGLTCLECKSTHVKRADSTECILRNNNDPAIKLAAEFCDRVNNSGPVICEECLEGFLLSTDQLTCLDQQNYPGKFCIEASLDGDYKCNAGKCIDMVNYVQIDTVRDCYEVNQDPFRNCETRDLSTDPPSCSKCDDISIQVVSNLDGPGKRCQLKDGVENRLKNCGQLNEVASQGGTFTYDTCTKCAENYQSFNQGRFCLNENEFPAKGCNPFFSISPNDLDSLNPTGTECRKCKSTHVLNTNDHFCYEKDNQNEIWKRALINCVEAKTQTTGDENIYCIDCDDDYLKTPNGTGCVQIENQSLNVNDQTVAKNCKILEEDGENCSVCQDNEISDPDEANHIYYNLRITTRRQAICESITILNCSVNLQSYNELITNSFNDDSVIDFSEAATVKASLCKTCIDNFEYRFDLVDLETNPRCISKYCNKEVGGLTGACDVCIENSVTNAYVKDTSTSLHFCKEIDISQSSLTHFKWCLEMDETSCLICDPSYANVNGECQVSTLDNCIVIENQKSNNLNNYQVCRTCEKSQVFNDQYQACVIDECETQTLLNDCEQCRPGYIRSLDQLNCIKDDTNPNCILFSNNLQDCLQCNTNYKLRRIGLIQGNPSFQSNKIICKDEEINGCANYFTEYQQQINNVVPEYFNHIQCRTCNTGRTLGSNNSVCMIDNCETRSDESWEYCRVCSLQNQLIPTENRQQCVDQAEVPDCKQVNDDGVNCNICKENFSIYFDTTWKCKPNTIERCENPIREFDKKINAARNGLQECDQCIEGYEVLSINSQDDICKVTHCKTEIEGGLRCDQCLDDEPAKYIFYKKNKDSKKCIRISLDEQYENENEHLRYCEIISVSGINCLKCEIDHPIVLFEEYDIQFCLHEIPELQQLDFCEEYEYENNNFEFPICAKCNFYFQPNEEGKCEAKNCNLHNETKVLDCIEQRCAQDYHHGQITIQNVQATVCYPNNQFLNCGLKDDISQECLTCQDGYSFINSGQQLCQIPPDNQHCLAYQLNKHERDYFICTVCDEDFREVNNSNGKCETIQCDSHNQHQECSACVQDHLLASDLSCQDNSTGIFDNCWVIGKSEKTGLEYDCDKCKVNYAMILEDDNTVNRCLSNDLSEGLKLVYNCSEVQNENSNPFPICKICETGFTLTNEYTCEIDNCESSSNETDLNQRKINKHCDSCYEGYWNSQNKQHCYYRNIFGRDENCKEINNEGWCIQCKPNDTDNDQLAMLEITENGIRFPICVQGNIQNCMTHQIQNNTAIYQRCAQCHQYYHLNEENDHKICVSDNCNSETEINCSQCKPNFILTKPNNVGDKRCVRQYNNCTTYLYSGECEVCNTDHAAIQINNQKECIKATPDDQIKKCAVYEQNNIKVYLQCQSCMVEFSVFPSDSDRKFCKQNSCEEFTDGICHGCKDTHLLFSDRDNSYPMCILKSEVPGCDVLETTNSCKKCLPGYAIFLNIDKNSCKSLEETRNALQNCELICEEINGADQTCNTIKATPQCKTCNTNFQLTQGKCQLENCQTFQQSKVDGTTHYCQNCLDTHKFTITRQYCVSKATLTSLNCELIYDDRARNGQCAKCLIRTTSNLLLAHIRQSEYVYRCVTPQTYKCTEFQIERNQKNYAVCTKCESNYEVIDSGANTQCQLENCKTILPCTSACSPGQTSCSDCKDEFMFTENKTKCLDKGKYSNCEIINDATELCTTCQGTYGLKKVTLDGNENFICSKGDIQLCEDYLETNQTAQLLCQSCLNSYQPSGDQRRCVLNNCEQYTNGICTRCINEQLPESDTTAFRFTKNNQQCVQKSDFQKCKQISELGTNCLECYPSYGIILITDKQDDRDIRCAQQPIPRCTSARIIKPLNRSDILTEPKCLQCNEYYNPLNNGTVCKLNQCLTSDTQTQTCSQCNPGYKFTVNKVQCILNSKFPNCSHINDLGNDCDQCAENYGIYYDVVSSQYKCKLNNIDSCSVVESMKSENLENPVIICKDCSPNYEKENNNTKCELVHVNECNVIENGICIECQGGYIPNTDKHLCLEQKDDLADCEIASLDGLECQTCLTSHAMVLTGNKHRCMAQQINLCLEIKNSNNSLSVQKCSKCHSGHYLENDRTECLKGDVSNCEIMKEGSKVICEKCDQNYFKIFIDNQYHKCINIQPHLICKNPDFIQYNDFEGFKIKCDSCEAGEVQTIRRRNICSQLQVVDNCSSYEQIQTGARCKECTNNYYLQVEDNRCKERTNIPECDVHSLTSDKCLSCIQDYHTINDGQSCQKNPEGTKNCQKYDSTGKNCLECGPFHYLEGSSCKFTEKVENCQFYIFENKCIICQDNYQLVEEAIIIDGNEIQNQCFLKKLSSKCVQENFSNPTLADCQVCDSSYKRVQNENQVHECLEVSTDNCQMYEDSTCILCTSEFYLDVENVCRTASTISSCLVHEGVNTCRKCAIDFILAVDKKSCLANNLNTKLCNDFQQKEEPVCQICSLGFQFNLQGQCVSLSDFGEKLDGCLVVQVDDTKRCKTCGFGFYMSSDHKCIANSSGGDTGGGIKVNSIKILTLLIFVLGF